jgi:hypothetical protein
MKAIPYAHNKEAKISTMLFDMIHEFSIQSITVDYSRKDNKTFNTVYFKLFVIGTTASKDNIIVLDLLDNNREDIVNMIVFARNFCYENKITFENKFAQDGYTYKNRRIFREVKKIK